MHYHEATQTSPYIPSTTSPSPGPDIQTAQMPQASSGGSMPTPPRAPKIKPIELPPMDFDDTSLNPMVEYAIRPPIKYDLRHHPAYASAPDAGSEWPNEPATNPPTCEMTIISRVLARPFVARPSNKDRDYVTIRDVLEATHMAFREAAQDVAINESCILGYSSGSPTSSGRYMWAGLSEQWALGTWLLHIE